MSTSQTEVLVVGAGPVGLWTALLLAEAGVEVMVIDREERTAARSYACALHPHTLGLLNRFGLAEEAVSRGRKATKFAFYDGADHKAELDLGATGGDFPFLLILPQNAFEQALEQRLKKAGITVKWNHRFDDMAEELRQVAATVEELGGTATGCTVPHWESTVKDRFAVRAEFLVGADGHNSLVRQRLGLTPERAQPPAFFAAYEFVSDKPADDEVRVVLDDATTNVLWPLPQNRYRWTFQLVRSELPAELPEKERRAVRLAEPQIDERIRNYVQKVAQRRAPWFSAPIQEIAWCSEVAFEGRVAPAFGRNRAWLAGDAAHQTGPVGVQSMNAGFIEAEALVQSLLKLLRRAGSPELLTEYSRQEKERWRRALGITGGLKGKADTSDWLRSRAARLLPCLPGWGDELDRLAAQLGLEWAEPQDKLSMAAKV